MPRKPAARHAPSSPDAAPNPDPAAVIAAHLAQGRTSLAVQLLLPVLDRRAAQGDRDCELAAAALRQAPDPADRAIPRPPDALSATMDRLVTLVRRQDEQIRTLRALAEDAL
ncbi:MAG: hypothetical protein NVSMB18_34950 [Acetobacteraceae bacterium]